MKYITTLFAFFAILTVQAQTIPNGSFENWTTNSYPVLDDYTTQIGITRFIFDSATVRRSSDSFSGDYSVLLETLSEGEDTIPGVFIASDFDEGNGIAYSQQPDSLIGYYKCDLQVDDTAGITIFFTNAGTPVSIEEVVFSNSQSSWTRFAIRLRYFNTPDSVNIFASSSRGEVVSPGSWLMLDSLHFVGTGITQQLPNNSFENWTDKTYDTPDSWQSINGLSSFYDETSVSQSTDSYSGTYALSVQTVDILDTAIGFLTNGILDLLADSIVGGIPYTDTRDTLVGYYQYTPTGTDTAAVGLYFFNNGAILDSAGVEFDALQSSYTAFEIPFSLSQAPDTLLINIVSSLEGPNKGVGSTLLIDSLIMKSIITSLDKNVLGLKDLSIYPNPTSEFLNLEFEALLKPFTLDIIDAVGRVYENKNIASGTQQVSVNISALRSGTYFVRLRSENELTHRSFIKL